MVIVTVVAVVVAVPMVIVFQAAMIAVPVTGEEPLTIVMRHHPASPLIRRPGPIAGMPPVAASHRIPIAIKPHIAGARGDRPDTDNARRRRWADTDPDRNLGEDRPGG
ncbi:exported hypothetical protein [Candidatus Sulfopaludibacter sp. SbA4]|nr:exported hypothetical protein [Candidatus Sulfopaludibacter sp. SbA4]